MKSHTYKVPSLNRLARCIIRPIFRSLFRVLGHVELNGLENIPRNGAYLVAPNHVSIFDGPFVLAFWPIILEFAGAKEIWERKGQSILAKFYGGIKVHRGNYDRAMIDKSLSCLNSGHPLLIAPEGGRSHEPGLRRANPGVAFLAEKAKVPIIPVGVYGCTEDFFQNGLRGKRQEIGMNIGKPLQLSRIDATGKNRKELRLDNADLVMTHIARLLPQEYRGYYSEKKFVDN